MSTPIGSDLPSLGSTNDPDSLSAPTVSPSPTEPVPIPSHHLFAPPLSHFPLSRSQSSCTSSVSDSSSEEEPAITLPPGILATFDAGPGTASIRRKPAPRPEMAIFLDPPVTGRSGAYVHLVKERLMGIFLSIYVHKGCEHLVQGLSYHSVPDCVSIEMG